MNIRRVIFYIVLIIGVVFAFCIWKVFGPAINNPANKFLYIKTGSSYQQVKDSLIKNDLLKESFWFDKIAKYADYPRKIKAGKYKITDGMSLYHLIKMLRSGKQTPVNLVITKLRTKEDLAKKIAANFETDSITVINFLNDENALRQFDVDTNTVMTDVIPNTYTYQWNNNVKNIFIKLDVADRTQAALYAVKNGFVKP